MSRESILDALRKIVEDYWRDNEKPLLFSMLPSFLEREIPGFKNEIEGGSLKKFVMEEPHGYILVDHPTQKAKIGLIPSGENYIFQDEIPGNKTPKNKDNVRKNENKAITLLRMLSDLPKEDIDKINIPLSVIVKLFK